jgi:hypothetical protein
VQAAISEKLGGFQHHSATFLVGLAIAFWRGWDMTLVGLERRAVLHRAGERRARAGG